jgi:hypothetical protein
MDEFLTVAEVAEVAELLKLNEQTVVENWIDQSRATGRSARAIPPRRLLGVR